MRVTLKKNMASYINMKTSFLPFGSRKFRLAALVLMSVAGFPVQAQFRHEMAGDKFPWTRPADVDGDSYRFVVLADKTGGPETGAFQRAIEEVNRLAPDFVMSIGDLVDGYTASPVTIREQWDSCSAMTGRLEAPFFFVGGNHDLSNEAMRREWLGRFGTTYYHFHVGQDLFLVLDTEEPGGISDRQAGYFAHVLQGWKGRWAYLFMHRPLWYPAAHGGFEKIEPLLAGADFTLFSGHEHRYYMERRNGHEYYILATTGGDSKLREPLLGEFDHYLHVSARSPRPAIANLRLGCMLPNDIVGKRNKPMADALSGTGYIETVPTVLPGDHPEKFEFEIRAINPCPQEMFFSATMPGIEGLAFEPEHIDERVAPNSERSFIVRAANPGKVSAVQFSKFPVKSSCGYVLAGELVSVSAEKDMLLDWNRPLEEGKPIDIACSDPAFVEEEWDWHGSEDGRFSIRAEWDGHSFSVTVTTSDDALVRSNGWESSQDMVSIFLATDSVQCARYDFAPGRPMRGDFAALRADGCCTAEGNSLSARLSVPAGCAGMGRIRLNVAFTDSDDARNVKPSVLWWKPEWGGKADFAGSGMFFLRPDHRLHRSSSALGGVP